MSAHTQTISHPTDAGPMLPYPFLSQPPLPKQKKRAPAPTQALPAPPAKQCTISSWAHHVQPGSPAPPSLSGTSISSFQIHITSITPHVDSPTCTGTTPSLRDFKVDLASVGYASMFGPRSAGMVPKTPVTPIGDRTNANAPIAAAVPAKKFGSLSILRGARPRANTTSVLPSAPTLPSKAPAPAPAQRKKEKSAYHPYARQPLPAPLANDLLLLQLLDGGSMESHIARAATSSAHQPGGVHRDGQGGVWRDEDEALEYAPLLPAPASASSSGWVKFGPGCPATSGAEAGAGDGEKRESTHSALHARPLRPLSPSSYLPSLPPAPRRNRTILVLPSRGGPARRGAGKPAYLVDLELAFPKTPTSPSSSAPRTPKSPVSASVRRRSSCSRSASRGRGRRPAPLTLDARGEFLGSSFAPAPMGMGAERKMSEDSDATVTMAGAVWEREHDAAAEGKKGKGVMKFFKRG